MFEPKTEADVSEIVRGATGPLVVRGGGTRGIGAVEGDVVSTAGVSGITLYEPGALTIVAQAGTPLAQVEAALAAENQRLPFEPPKLGAVLGRSGESTIGGVVAANASGPRRVQAGACRDSLIGVRFVDGRGDIIKNGGRVMKNVTGYDLVKLMAGSYGTLGVLTEVSFKVLPGISAETTVRVAVPSAQAAVEAMSAALGSSYEVSGAAYVGGEVVLRLEGFDTSVEYRAEKIAALMERMGDVSTCAGDASKAVWAGVRDVSVLSGVAGNLWRVSVKPSDGPRVTEALGDAPYLMDWGGGLIWAVLPEGEDLRARLGDIPDPVGGHATLMRGTGAVPFHPEPTPLAVLSAGLRAQFDPAGRLNAGLMGRA